MSQKCYTHTAAHLAIGVTTHTCYVKSETYSLFSHAPCYVKSDTIFSLLHHASCYVKLEIFSLSPLRTMFRKNMHFNIIIYIYIPENTHIIFVHICSYTTPHLAIFPFFCSPPYFFILFCYIRLRCKPNNRWFPW